mgnify:CR=1 FL=1
MSYCIIIEKELVTNICPVPEANCMWRHRVTKECKYSSELQGAPPHVVAPIVGVRTPYDSEIENLRAALRAAITKELT